MRVIEKEEIQSLLPCLEALAAHHNAVSVNFPGSYPARPYEEILKQFENAVGAQTSEIAVAEDGGRIAGFCKVDFHGDSGKLDYLVVLPEYRGKGYGMELMDRAMQTFAEHSIHRVEVKVVDGNEAMTFYEKYGFQMNAHILVKTEFTES